MNDAGRRDAELIANYFGSRFNKIGLEMYVDLKVVNLFL